MANMAASGVYQQMIVPAPYHYPQCQVNASVGTSSQLTCKKENKKRKKVIDKCGIDKKKAKSAQALVGGLGAGTVGLSQPNFLSLSSNNRSEPGEIMPTLTVSAPEKLIKFEACPVCNKKKCFKHVDAKHRNHLSKKTPDDIIIQMKKHMLKLLSNQDSSNFCKIDQKINKIDVDISKMHQMYLEEYEPTVNNTVSLTQDKSKDQKPKVKKWLYRKVFLDEFKTFELNACKRHLGDLRRNIDTVIQQKKKKPGKSKMSSQQAAQNQVMPQDYSLPTTNPSDLTRPPGLPPGVIGPPSHNSAVSTPTGYQSNLMGGLDAPPTSMGATTSPSLHNSLASYMTQQVPLLFGQQHTQQQPLNLQTSPHQGPLQHQGGHPAHPGGTAPPTAPGAPLPLNLHNPYYVSFGPMLPLHMSPQHNPQQQFQQNLMAPPQQHSFNQHAMYQ